MNNSNNKLGKGLSSLLGEKKINLNSGLMGIELNPADKVQKIDISLLEPNRFQPRKYFNPDELEELADSIRQYGVLQPLVVRKLAEDERKFEIIAGERRFRASKIAGLDVVPVIIKDFDDKDVLSLAIIENIQRSDLSVMEEAEAYNSLIEDFNYTQEDVATFVGKSRSHIANLVRLLVLPIEIKEKMYRKELSMGHARALINCDDSIKIADIVIEHNLNVRDTEKLVKDYNKKKNIDNSTKIKEVETIALNKEYFKQIEKALSNRFNLKSKINFNNNNQKGKITISYNSLAELEAFLNIIGG